MSLRFMDIVMIASKTLRDNLDKIHSTELGLLRVKNNLELTEDPVMYCIKHILNDENSIIKKGKNYYVTTDCEVITINANSFTIITAHKLKK